VIKLHEECHLQLRQHWQWQDRMIGNNLRLWLGFDWTILDTTLKKTTESVCEFFDDKCLLQLFSAKAA